MATTHLSVSELEGRFRSAKGTVEKSHFQVIWLLAKGHAKAEVAAITALSSRWINKIARRYEEHGPEALGDLRRQNGGGKPLIAADDLEALRERLRTPPDDGGAWTSKKVAGWLADRLGLERVHIQRGWEALKRIGWSLQSPRPRHPQAAGPEEAEAYKKSSRARSPKKPRGTRACRSRSGPRTSTGSG